jgi:hypothetical protein
MKMLFVRRSKACPESRAEAVIVPRSGTFNVNNNRSSPVAPRAICATTVPKLPHEGRALRPSLSPWAAALYSLMPDFGRTFFLFQEAALARGRIQVQSVLQGAKNVFAFAMHILNPVHRQPARATSSRNSTDVKVIRSRGTFWETASTG